MRLVRNQYNMAVIKCRRSRGDKLEKKTSSRLAMCNLAVERGLQELLLVFGVLICPHVSVVVVASSHVAVRYDETRKTFSCKSKTTLSERNFFFS